jgi:MinD-like ATPase involved in chromosome partitioning or flagellar assembly
VRQLNDGFRQLVKALALDYLFIDTHPGLSKETFLTIAISHCLLLIVRPDKQDYQGAAVTLDVARQLNVRRVQVGDQQSPILPVAASGAVPKSGRDLRRARGGFVSLV